MYVQLNKNNGKSLFKFIMIILIIVSLLLAFIYFINEMFTGPLLGVLEAAVIFVSAVICFKMVYNYLPLYKYRIINNEIYIERQFSQNYSNVYLIKVDDIISFKKFNKKSYKMWNKFYHLKDEGEIYLIKAEDSNLLIKPDKKFIEILNKKLETTEN